MRVSEDRYRPGGRRTSAEPLRASWQPKVDPAEEDESDIPTSGKLTKLSRTYGWRVYALPILVVLTVLIVLNTANSPAQPIASGQQAQSPAATGTGSVANDPAVNESPAKQLNIPTAVLPGGGDFTQQGKGTFHVLPIPPGGGKKVGTAGKLYTYTVEVEDGIDASSFSGEDTFADAVEATLSNPQSWTGTGQVQFQRVDATYPKPSFRVSLTTPATDHREDVCGYTITYESSCYRKSFDSRVVINLARWVRGAIAFAGDMGIYRQYAINHEVGHAVGKSHVGCPGNGELAPVMMQQTFGVSDDYVADLNKVDPTNYSAVAKDGRVCKVNPWPNPQAQPTG
ncbi:MAG: hypothetical protein JWQ81_2836 [Amycolatopsis sp.]|nr:hypothetical protein [Amycolatopsis sp.]